ncbi:MAG: M15 family metallopeptidase [Lachnospiraceae bacterium]|nr:M15 family metallopeptidase [Lachnospiraceae bacterium]
MSSNSDRQRKNAARKAARQKKVRRQIAVLVVLVIVLIAAIAFVFQRSFPTISPKSGESAVVSAASPTETGSLADSVDVGRAEAESENADATEADSDSGTLISEISAPEKKTIELTSQMLHSGDLIVVSATHAYDFDANADSVNLVNIKDNQSYAYPVDKDELELARRALTPLDQMIKACDEALGTSVTAVSSAYRSEQYQQNVWDEDVATYGEDHARAYVAAPGYSEHHTGLAVDLGIIHSDGSYGSFSGSDNAAWIKQNCYKYGYIRRYAEDKVSITGISNEEWHFRYVGLPHAKFMYEKNYCLEEYISYLRDNTSAESPLSITTDDGSNYSVYFTAESEIDEPEGDYDISGNNIDGWIITEKVG